MLGNRDYIINLTYGGGLARFTAQETRYIDIAGHRLTYHTDKGDFSDWDSLSKLEKDFAKYGFLRCNNYCIVNTRYISRVNGYDIELVTGETLQISRPKKKKFMTDFTNLLGGNGVL